MSPESVFHIAARLIFLHMNHIMLLLCSKLSRALISVRRKVKVFNTTYKVPCDLPHPSTCDLCLQLRSYPPRLFHSRHSGPLFFRHANVCSPPDLCTCYSMCLEVLSPDGLNPCLRSGTAQMW